MYVSVLTVVVGWWLTTGSRLLAGYAATLAIGFHLRVLYHEEPWLLRQFGDEWVAYSASVRRWLPRLRRWQQGDRG
jgi:protein-S-isoprenylcysteine O-methyltransferase Ste14